MLKKLAIAAVASFAVAGAAHARDTIKIVGSSTVYPYAKVAAENWSKKTGKPAPIVESTGTGGGAKIFCGGVGENFPDITNASRRMKTSEFNLCASNGVKSISEAMIGYDGLTLAYSSANKTNYDFTPREIFLALAAKIPQGTKWVPNPYKTWDQIRKGLPKTPIRVFGPPPTSGTRDAFVELTMWIGCETFGIMDAQKAALSADDYTNYRKANCSAMRQDGPFIEAGENDNVIVARLIADPNALGIFGYSFLFENQDKLKAAAISGVLPSEDSIADFSYPIARPLFFYVKNAHRSVVPGLTDFAVYFASKEVIGADGLAEEHGLTPASEAKRKIAEKNVSGAGVPMTTP